MGWWTLKARKEDTNGKSVELEDVDLEHIAQCIIDGCTNGEICDKEN